MFFKKKKITRITGEEELICPRCGISMEKLKKEEVIVDVCKKCKGMWLDAGEMEKLAQMAQTIKAQDQSQKDKEEKKNGKKK